MFLSFSPDLVVDAKSFSPQRHVTATIVYTCVPCYRPRGIETAIKPLVVAKAYIAVICPSFLATAASVRYKGSDKSLRLRGARTGRRDGTLKLRDKSP